MFLGIYDYTVILTYISLGISVFGITRALEGDFKVAIFCLALSGLSHIPLLYSRSDHNQCGLFPAG